MQQTPQRPSWILFVIAALLAFPAVSHVAKESAHGAVPVPAAASGPSDFDTVRTNLQDYIWPTDASTKITSSFAEYRATHFHGGIDISTNGVKGYRVFAARDGYVARINISPDGYGKMLYLRHGDGYYTTYAHLLTFNDEISKIVRAEQYRRGTYAINLTLDPGRLPVTRGEVVAYTGESGVGPPHLHFEIRDENLNPVNPMMCTKFSFRDDIPPSIRRVMIAPVSYGSTVDGVEAPRYFSRFPRSKHKLSIPQTIRLHGNIGFGVDADDLSDGTASRAGVHRIEFYIDDQLTYSMELNRVPADETKQIDLHYDLGSLLRGHGKFQKLYIDQGNVLPFYAHKPEGTGIINTDKLAEGRHDYRIVCLDNSGNQAELTGSFLANHKPDVTLGGVTPGSVTLSGHGLRSIARWYIFGKRAYQPTWTQHTIDRKRSEWGDTSAVLPVNTAPYDVIKVVAESESGSQSEPMYRFIKKMSGPARPVHLKVENKGSYFALTLLTAGVFTAPPEVSVTEGSSVRTVHLEPADVSRYTGAFQPQSPGLERRGIRIRAEVDGAMTESVDSLSGLAILPASGGSYSIDGGNLLLRCDSAAVYRPLCLEVSSDNDNRSSYYSLTPDDVLLDRGITVTLPSASREGTDHLGLYFRGNGGWNLMTARPDSGGRTFSATLTRTLGDVAVFHDGVPPAFGRLRVQARKGSLLVSFRYSDNLSGVDTDEIKIHVDDTLVIPEIDGEHHLVSLRTEGALPRGRHTVHITMKDRVGNTAEIERTVTVH
jgi:hypothetical protein